MTRVDLGLLVNDALVLAVGYELYWQWVRGLPGDGVAEEATPAEAAPAS